MRVCIYIYIIVFFSSCFLHAEAVSIQIRAKNATVSEISVFINDILGDRKTLVKQKMELNGDVLLKFEVERPIFAFINLGPLNQTIYVKPKSNYVVLVDYLSSSLDVRFEGEDKEINNFLEQQKEYFRNYKYKSKVYYQWNLEEFPIGIQQIDSLLRQKIFLFFKTNNISNEEKKIIENLGLIDVLTAKMNHFYSNYNPVYRKTNNIPKILNDIEKETLFDEKIFELKSESYEMVLRQYYRIATSKKIIKIIPNRDNISLDAYLKFSFSDIERYEIPVKIKEYILADLLVYTFSSNEIPKCFDDCFTKYKIKFPNSEYLKSIEKIYDNTVSLKSGKVSMDIIGKNIKGLDAKLSDYYGKVIYLDFWATWCGPCIKELPYSVLLQKKYKTEKNLVFVYVSVDKNNNDWRKYLLNHSEIKGIHINIDEEEYSKIQDFYMISGIPRYLIIGKDGKILDGNAERPSSSKVEEQLKNILLTK